VLTINFSVLHDIIENSLVVLSRDMYAEGLISKNVKDSPTYNAIMTDFTAKMKIKDEKQELHQHCTAFIDILSRRGHRDVASHLVRQWNKEINNVLNTSAFFDEILIPTGATNVPELKNTNPQPSTSKWYITI
jgi:hypothetical protein